MRALRMPFLSLVRNASFQIRQLPKPLPTVTIISPKQLMRWRWLGLAFALWTIDQAVKYGVTQTMQLNESRPIFAGFNWVYVLNPGAAFSFLADAGGWQRYFFTAIGLIVSTVLIVLLWRGVAARLEALAYALLIAGALGNVTDRLRVGAVVDYLDLYWRTSHWPAFNFADVCISIAATLLLVSAWRERKPIPTDQGKRRVA